MRPLWPLLFFSTALFAGCFGGDDEPAPTAPPPAPYSQFLCADGTLHSSTDTDKCNVRITRNPPRNAGPANELTISVDPTNPLRLVAGAKDYTLGEDDRCGKHRVWSGVYWSSDGGFTWQTSLFPGFDQTTGAQTQSATNGYDCNTDPVAYWDEQGTAYYSGLAYSLERAPGVPGSPIPNDFGVGNNLWIAKSMDGGKTWTRAYVIAQGSDDLGTLHDKQWFTIDRKSGNVYITWSMFLTNPVAHPSTPLNPVIYQNQIEFSRSTDRGQTWSPPRTLFDSQSDGRGGLPIPEFEHQFSMPAVDADGRIHVTWRTQDGKIWYTTSSDQGATWATGKTIAENILMPCPDGTQCPPKNSAFRVDTSPVLAVDTSAGPNKNSLYVVYAANATRTDNLEIYLLRSKDRGATWSAPARVNDDNGTSDQFMPWMDVGPQGDVHILYYDRQYDPGNRLLDVSYVHSKDGATFDPSVRVTEVSSDARFSYHQSGREFIGDYFQIVEGTNGWVHPIWVDTREGVADAYTTVIAR